jgi:hypothetical protein
MRTLKIGLIVALFIGGLAGTAAGQLAGDYRVEPSSVDIELVAGGATTTAFVIHAEPKWMLREKLLLSLADWDVDKNGILIYTEPGTAAHSASPFLTVHPAAVTLSSGDSKLIRLTVRVPEATEPGVYTSAVLVEDKVPGPPLTLDGPATTSKILYAFTVTVTVRPARPVLTHAIR